MLFQDAPPDTSAYMILGFTVFFVISAIYVASLAVRRRNLEQDLRILDSVRAESERPTQPRAGAKAAAQPPKRTRQGAGRAKQTRKKVTRRR